MKKEEGLRYGWAQRWIQHRLRTFFRVSRREIEHHFSCTQKTVTVYLQTYEQELGATEGPQAVAYRHPALKERDLFLPLPPSFPVNASPFIGNGDDELRAWRQAGMIPRSKSEAWALLGQLRGHELMAIAGDEHSTGETTEFYPGGSVAPLHAIRLNNDKSSEDTRMFTSVETLLPAVSGLAVAMTLQALFLRSTLRISYRTKSGKDTDRLISPHHLVFADNRYHVRAFDHRTDEHDGMQRFIDFNVGRIIPLGLDGFRSFKGQQEDQEWRNPVTLKFQINRSLPASLKEAVEETYMLSSGQDIIVKTTEALMHYVLREWQQKVFPPSAVNPVYMAYFSVVGEEAQ